MAVALEPLISLSPGSLSHTEPSELPSTTSPLPGQVRENVERELEQSRVRSREQLAVMRREERAARKTLAVLTEQLEASLHMGAHAIDCSTASSISSDGVAPTQAEPEAELDSSVLRVSDSDAAG